MPTTIMRRLVLPLSTTMVIKISITTSAPTPLQQQEAQAKASLLVPKPSDWAHTGPFSPAKIQNPNHQLRLPRDQPLQPKTTSQILHTSTTGSAGIAECTQNWAFQDPYICAAGLDVRAATFEDSFCIVPTSRRCVHEKKKIKNKSKTNRIIPCIIPP